MKLQMAAIALVSAMLGGVFGIAVWRAIDARGIPAEPARIAAPQQRWWYCHFAGPNRSGEYGEFTTCTRELRQCSDMFACMPSTHAWCGRLSDEPCTLERQLCEAYPNNAPCVRVEP